MPKHKDATPNSADHSYEVGYGKPPTHGRFRPGQSGNPAGRPKDLNNLRTDVKRILEIPVRVQEVGRSRRISTQRGALLRLREKALQGDDRAIKHIIELAFRFNDDAGETAAPNLPPDDQAILADYRAEILAAARPTTPAEPPRRDGVEPGPESSPQNDESSE